MRAVRSPASRNISLQLRRELSEFAVDSGQSILGLKAGCQFDLASLVGEPKRGFEDHGGSALRRPDVRLMVGSYKLARRELDLLPKESMVIALVIDDSRAMRSILRRMLQEFGLTVMEAANGIEGLRQLHDHPKPALALVDWYMPLMDGLAWIRAVRADPANREMRLMMVSTETDAAQIASALEAGADEYVMKPFTKAMICEKLALLGITSR